MHTANYPVLLGRASKLLLDASTRARRDDLALQDFLEDTLPLGIKVYVYIQIIATWGPKVCNYNLHWTIWIFRVGYPSI